MMKVKYLTISTYTLFLLLLVACTAEPAKEEAPIVVSGNPAISGISEQIAANPTDASLYAARAEIYYEEEGYDEAIQDLQQALHIDSVNVQYLHLLADVYLDYFKSKPALETMEKAAELYPERIPTLLKLSEFQFLLTKYNPSMVTIDKILKIDPQNADAYFMFGRNFREMGDTVRAINSFQTAVENDPDLVEAWIYLGQLYEERGDPLANRYYDNAIEVAPNNIEALFAKAIYLQNQDRLPEAIEIYRRINIIDPQYASSFFNAGLLYLELDSIQQAYQQFDLTVKTSPTHIKGYFYRGLASEMLGNFSTAKADYNQALRMAPEYEKAREAYDRLDSKAN